MKEEGIYKKLSLIQEVLKVPKGQHNEFGNYPYRSCEDILEAAKPVAKEHRCVITLSDTMVEVGGRVFVKATASITCIESGSQISTDGYAREAESRPKFDVSQLTGSASSYARKYSLNGLLSIDDTKDADGLKPDNEKPKPQIKPKEDDTLKAFLSKVEEGRKAIGEDNYKKALDEFNVDSPGKVNPKIRQNFVEYMRKFK